MSATPDIIPSDLTLEIGEDLSPDEFLAMTRAWFGYVKEITATVTPEGEKVEWAVKVREGSALIGVDPKPSAPPEVVCAVYSKTETGLRRLGQGHLDGSGLPEAALVHLRTISDLSIDRARRRRLRVWVQRRPLDVDDAIGRLIAEDWRTAYADYGIVEGRLDAITDHGKLEIRVRDAALRQTVKCFFPEELLDEAFACFRKRVEVSGIVNYRRNGTPVSIDVAQVERVPDDSDLPTAADVRGILGAA